MIPIYPINLEGLGVRLEPLTHEHHDELAAAASLLQGQAAEGTPVVLIRGARFDPGAGAGRTKLLREPDKDLFR